MPTRNVNLTDELDSFCTPESRERTLRKCQPGCQGRPQDIGARQHLPGRAKVSTLRNAIFSKSSLFCTKSDITRRRFRQQSPSASPMHAIATSTPAKSGAARMNRIGPTSSPTRRPSTSRENPP